MAVFDLSNAAGRGFDMSAVSAQGWSYAEANPNITTQLTYDDGFVALFDIYGSAVFDQVGITYSVSGDIWTIYDIAYANYGTVILSIEDLYLQTTTSDLMASSWFVTLNPADDDFYGNDFDDMIHAGYGDDYVVGFSGADTLFGDQGNDVIYGGAGNDTLTGGAGYDSFVFNTFPSSAANIDRITDFNVKQDTIQLDNAVMPALGGAMESREFWKSASGLAHDRNDHIIYETDTGWLNYDSNGSATGGAVHLAKLAPKLALTYLDFSVIQSILQPSEITWRRINAAKTKS